MERRELLRSCALLSAFRILPGGSRLFADTPNSRWRTFEVTTRAEVLKPSGRTRLWLPTPLTIETPYQKTLSNHFVGQGGSVRMHELTADAAGIVAAEFAAGVRPVLTLTSRVSTRNHAVELYAPAAPGIELKNASEHFRRSTRMLPTDGVVKTADLNALYVGLARAAGLAARDVYGLRVAKSENGYQSLGAASSNVTKAQH